jgi:hypothetical protein
MLVAMLLKRDRDELICTQNLFCSWALRHRLAFLFQRSRMFRHLIPVLHKFLISVTALNGQLRPGFAGEVFSADFTPPTHPRSPNQPPRINGQIHLRSKSALSTFRIRHETGPHFRADYFHSGINNLSYPLLSLSSQLHPQLRPHF